jgi:hypothetical protein
MFKYQNVPLNNQLPLKDWPVYIYTSSTAHTPTLPMATFNKHREIQPRGFVSIKSLSNTHQSLQCRSCCLTYRALGISLQCCSSSSSNFTQRCVHNAITFIAC